MQDEGYIKYTVDWEDSCIDHNPWIPLVNRTRAYCHDRGWIGILPDGIGFGNISVRLPDNTFMITGTQTGHKRMLTIADYAVVTEYDIVQNSLRCRGCRRASSESLTHASLYAASSHIDAVIHIHDEDLWQRYKDHLPTTPASVPYGTPDMAKAVKDLVRRYPGEVIIMGGHQDGILAYGDSLRVAQNRLEVLE